MPVVRSKFGLTSETLGMPQKAVTPLEHICDLDIDTEPNTNRMSGIVCTIGPACDSVRCLRTMMENGLNICRLNLAHGSYEYHALVIKNIKEAATFLSSPRQIAIAVDITGPGIRLGKLQVELGSEVYLKKGHMIRLTNDLTFRDEGTQDCVFVCRPVVCTSTLYVFVCQELGSEVYLKKGHMIRLTNDLTFRDEGTQDCVFVCRPVVCTSTLYVFVCQELGSEVYLKKGHMIRLTNDLTFRDEGTQDCVFVCRPVVCTATLYVFVCQELGSEVYLKKGHMIRLTNDLTFRDEGTQDCMFVDHIELIEKTKIGSHIFIEDGTTSLVVKEKGSDFIICEVDDEGIIGSRHYCNIPGVLPWKPELRLCSDFIICEVDDEGIIGSRHYCNIPGVLPGSDFIICEVDDEGIIGSRHYCNIPGVLPGKPELTRKDKKDIKFVLDHNIDIIFASYIWSATEIDEIRERLGAKGQNVKVIAKIENYEGVRRFDDILKHSDGIMVARGNLGIDISPEKVFLAQKMMIGKCNKAGKPAIIATQMLDSMTRNPRPTRAEVADVANAVLDGADCVMLGKETAMGKHPIKTVKTILSICREAESTVFHEKVFRELREEITGPTGSTHTTAVAAVEAAFRCQATAIFVITSTGRSAALLAQYRPPCVIVAVTRSSQVARQLHLHRGVFPVFHDFTRSPDWMTDIDHRITRAVMIAKDRGYVKPNDVIILVTGWTAGAGSTNTVRVINLMEEIEQQTFMSSRHLKAPSTMARVQSADIL
ncbi:pyruvate kinase PKM-like [Liolophura sinensis]|uniref:pyruvate kinase PKM-like n=1 Tax=Liolophura sinensis TaxID=3198878 RepID=UPI003158D87F